MQHDQDEPGQFRVLHWNIHGWRDAAGQPNADAVISLIYDTRPDAVSLVEVDEPWALPSTLSEVAGRSGYAWVFVPSFEYGTNGAGGFGNALLARPPVTAVQQWQIFTLSGGYDGSEPSEPRSVILARLLLDSGPFWLGSTHFPRNDPDARQAAAHRLRQILAQLNEPWLICGDFNSQPGSCFGEHDTLQISPNPVQPTYPADAPDEAIDYCIAAHGLAATTTVLQAQGSDHLPLLTMAYLKGYGRRCLGYGPDEAGFAWPRANGR